jgi:hypothetical protein
MPMSLAQLVGRWRKSEATPEPSPYPDVVEFFQDGTYRASSERRRSAWDEAAFDIIDPTHLRMETASDRKAVYGADLVGDVLIIDDGQHRVTYTRRQ